MELPSFKYEKKVWKRGFKVVAGADEVGRGALAGPLVAAAVLFKDAFVEIPVRVDDSKKLSALQREKADKWIRENCLGLGIGEVSVSFINKHGIVKATRAAFRKALKNLKVEFLLVDAFYVPYTKGVKRKNQLAIIKGDQKSISIAAASIVAKVYRDRLMTEFSKKHKNYNQDLSVYSWDKNAGYGTQEHIEAIKKHGSTRFHRKQFIRKIFV